MNTSGGGGGGAAVSGGGSATGGAGGSAGSINITTSTSASITITGPILAAGGGGGGASNAIASGGGSFGGGGGSTTDVSSGPGGGGGFYGGGGVLGYNAGGGGATSGGQPSSGEGTAGTIGAGGAGGGSGAGAAGLFGSAGGLPTLGGNAGGNVGQAGTGGGGVGGAAGNGGAITISGGTVAILDTVSSYYGGQYPSYASNFSGSSYAGQSVNNVGSGAASITVTAGNGSSPAVGSTTYDLVNNLSSTTRNFTADIIGGGGTPFVISQSPVTNGTAGYISSSGTITINTILAGTNTTLTSGSYGSGTGITITEYNGATPAMVTITNGEMVTPAEWIAAIEVSGGSQTLTLSTSGNATGGTFNIGTSNLPTISGSNTGFAELVIPASVTGTYSSSNTLYLPGSAGPNTISGALTIASGAGATINLNSLTNNGTITNNAATALVFSASSANLTISGTGTITSNAGININAVSGSVSVTQSSIATTSSGSVSIAANGTGSTATIGSSITTSGAPLTILAASDITTASGISITTSGGTINITAGGNFNNLGSNISSDTVNSNAGTISITSTGATSFGNNVTLSAMATGTGNGGTVNITSGSGISTGTNFTINANSANGGDGGSIMLTASGAITTGINLNISANANSAGGNGGRIDLLANGDITINSGGTVTADSTTGSGGKIQFASATPGAASITVTNDGTVQATDNSDTSGIIGFNSGDPNTITVTGSGTLFAGQYVGFGDIVPSTLQVLSPIIVPTTNAFNLTPYSVSQGGNILNQIQVSGTLPPPVPPPVSPPTIPVVSSTAEESETVSQSGVTVIATDINKSRLLPSSKINSHLASPCGSYISIGSTAKNKAWIVSSNYYQPFNYEGDGSGVLLAAPGTVFAPESKYNLVLREGKLTAITGEHAVDVQTEQGQVRIPAHSTVIVEQTRKNLVRVDNLDGGETNLEPNKKLSKTVSASRGEEVVIADDSLSEEELIPVDGVPREPISGGKVIEAGVKNVGKTRFDPAKLAQRDYWLFMMVPCVDHPIQTRLLDLKQKLSVPVILKSETLDSKNISKGETISKLEEHYQASSEMPFPLIALPIVVDANPKMNFHSLVSKAASIRYVSGTNMTIDSSGAISMEDGEALIYATEAIQLRCGIQVVNLKAGTVVWLSRQNDCTRICSLAAQSPNAVQVMLGPKSIHASYGQELMLGDKELPLRMKEDTIARRNINLIDVSENASIAKSEISILSVLNYSDLLSQIYASHNKQDKVILDKILKMAACLNVVTGSKGPYNTLN